VCSQKAEVTISSLDDKQHYLKKLFASLSNPEEKYQEIMSWGKKLSPYPEEHKIEKNLVPGCQSLLYLHAEQIENCLHFYADSDALISKGLAALLVYYYSGETAESVLKSKPTFLETLGIVQSLSPTRAGGVASLYVKMQKEALAALVSYQS
jgi:cysteine desulfuration protein SufE